MKKHSFLLSFCSVLSMFVLLHVLFSCSNQQAQTEDVSEAEASEIISEEGSSDTSSEASLETENPEAKQAAISELESTISADETTDAETSLGDASAESSLGSETATETTIAPSTGESLGSITAAEDEEQQTSLSDLNPASEPAPGFEQNLGETIPEPSGEVPQQPIVQKSKGSKKPRYVGAPLDTPKRTGGVAKAPTIPGKAFEKNGVLLNRFYFARQGDNPKKVSLLLYGDATKTKALADWNKGAFSAGKLIFYSSPVNGTDQKMQSFYQERQVPFEQHTVGPKESLGAIAKKKLGANGSWKEIAVLNGLEKYNSAQAGQKLEIMPKDLAAVAPKLQANVPTPVPEPPQVAQATPAPNVGEPPPVVEAPKPPAQNAVSSSDSDVDYGNLLTQNLFPIVVGAAVLVFLILLIAIGKRKKKTVLSEDFPEDGFSAPPKLKKRK